MSPLLAQSGQSSRTRECPLLGVNRTSRRLVTTSAYDPERKSPAFSSVSVRRVVESYESVVIQEWWPDSRRVTDVDEQEPRALRPQQVAIPERFDRRRMEAGRTFDPTWQARRRQADGDHV